MPNYVTNLIYAKDTKVLLNKMTRIEKGERIVDFNLLIPRPSDLDIESGSSSYITAGIFKDERLALQAKLIDTALKDFYNSKITQSRFVLAVKKGWDKIKNRFAFVYSQGLDFEKYEIIIKGYFNTQRYGYRDWYEWSYANWGTKWNGSDYEEIRVSNDLQGISFDTAWACPVPVLLELSKYTPIVVMYSDEDLGNNYGILKISKGKVKVILDDRKKSFFEAVACNGGDEYYVSDYLDGNDYSEEELEDLYGASSIDKIEKKAKVVINKVNKLLDKNIAEIKGE